MRNKTLLLIFVSLFSFIELISAGGFRFRHYRAEDGLSYNSVRSILQDRRGFIWIGTEDGLNRFDGYTFKEFRSKPGGTGLLESNYISALLEDDKGIIYIGTDEGIYTYDPATEKFTRLNVKTSGGVTISSTINNLVLDKSGNLWIATYGQGIFNYQLSSGKLQQYLFSTINSQRIKSDLINCIFADRSNRIWAGQKGPSTSLMLFNPKANRFDIFPFIVEGDNSYSSIYRIYEDSYRNLWLGTWDRGIYKLDSKLHKVVSYLSPKSQSGILHVHEICEYSPGELLVGSDDGLSLFNTRTLTHRLFTASETDPTSLSDKFIYPIYKDREGGLWVGTYYGGVNYVSPTSGLFERYTHSGFVNSVNGNVIGGFTEDKSGNIWIASDDGGLNRLDKQTGRFTSYMPQPGRNSISYYNVHALCWDDEKLWIGTYSGGLNVFDSRTGNFKLYKDEANNPKSLDGSSIYAIFKDRSKRMWVASMSGLNLYNRTEDNFTRVKNLDATTIDIEQDARGRIWFGTWGKGVFCFDEPKHQWRNYLCHQGDTTSLTGNQINCMLMDHHARLWVGTTNGLCRFDDAKNRFVRIHLNIPSNTICSIVEDNELLWITTSKGLVRYDTRNGNSQVFTQSDGLLSDQFIANSGFKSSNGKIYIGTANGFNAFYPNNIARNNYIPPVVISRLEIFNKEVQVGEEGPLPKAIQAMKRIDLSYKDNVFSLDFVALSYNTPGKNKYAYKLEGFDKDWNYVTNQHRATYTNLPAGSYAFKVKACNNDGVWNEQGTSVEIIIHPPFWLTPVFKLLYVLLFIGLMVWIAKSWMKRTERKHKEKIDQLNHEKETELYNAKISFFTTIAHEIRTPVSLIIGPLEKIMTTATNLPELLRNDLNIIDRNSQRLLLLVNQLLDFRKVEQGALALTFIHRNVPDLLRSTFDRFYPLSDQKGIKFVFDCPDTTIEADIDQEALTKIVSNLLSNAMKYAKGKIVFSCLSGTERFEIMVTDDGQGIPDNEKEKIFLPFYQVSSGVKPGTGIGLSLVKSLVDAHGGEISVTNAFPAGSCFTVSFPLRNDAVVSGDVVPETSAFEEPESQDVLFEHSGISESKSKEKPLLLVVEDNPEMRGFLQDSFSSDYSVITAEDGLDGLDKLKNNEVSLIISDLMMPRMDGLEFCSALRANVLTSHIPVVLLTAKTDLNTKIDGMNSGADAYVEKPFSIRFLKAQIRNLIDSRKALRRKYSEMPFVPLNSIAGNKADEDFLSKLNTLIENYISNPDFSVELLAEELAISRSGLFAKIKTLAGVTPNELMQVVRLKKAAELLAENKYRINEVAYMVGFNNPSYFTKCFQKQFGVRPGEFLGKSGEV
jgi:Signal transduction histidine kinase